MALLRRGDLPWRPQGVSTQTKMYRGPALKGQSAACDRRYAAAHRFSLTRPVAYAVRHFPGGDRHGAIDETLTAYATDSDARFAVADSMSLARVCPVTRTVAPNGDHVTQRLTAVVPRAMGFGALAYIDEEGHRSYLYYEERAAGPVLVVVVGWGPDVSRSELRSLTDRAAARVDAVVGRPS